MSFLASLTGSKAIVSVLAIGAGGVLGYNWVTTGCPSGVCPSERAASAAVVNVSDTAEAADSCCSLGTAVADKASCASECETPCTDKAVAEAGEAGGCCALMAEVSNVALTTETKEADSCCSTEAKVEKAEADSCCASEPAPQQTATNTP